MQRGAQRRSEEEQGPGVYPVNLPDPSPSFTAPAQRSAQSAVPQPDGEAALLDQARSGNADAFASLVTGHFKTLYRLARRITRNHEDAEDAVQDAVLKAHAHLSTFQGRAQFSTWISRIAINEALMKRRKYRNWNVVAWEDLTPAEESEVCSWIVDLRQDPEALYARREVREMMLEAARDMPPMYQAVFFLSRVRGCTNQETADHLDVSVATVKARLHRACKRLREKLAPAVEALPC